MILVLIGVLVMNANQTKTTFPLFSPKKKKMKLEFMHIYIYFSISLSMLYNCNLKKIKENNIKDKKWIESEFFNIIGGERAGHWPPPNHYPIKETEAKMQASRSLPLK